MNRIDIKLINKWTPTRIEIANIDEAQHIFDTLDEAIDSNESVAFRVGDKNYSFYGNQIESLDFRPDLSQMREGTAYDRTYNIKTQEHSR